MGDLLKIGSAFFLDNGAARLRPMAFSDCSKVLEWRNSNRARFLHRGATNLASQQEWFLERPRDEVNFIICCTCGRDVGMVSLCSISVEEGRAEPGRLFVERKYSRGGFAVSALSLLYGYAFDDLGVTSLLGTIALENQSMIQWQQYFGFSITRNGSGPLVSGSPALPLVHVELSRDQYLASTKPKQEKVVQAVLEESNRLGTCPCGSPSLLHAGY